MKFRSIALGLVLLPLAYSVQSAEPLPIETIIDNALRNSPSSAQIMRDITYAKAEAFDIETLDNPEAQITLLTIKEGSDNRTAELELEQPLRLSHFSTRKRYAEALRQTADIEQKAKLLEVVHSITRGYASYWALQEQEKMLTRAVEYTTRKLRLIQRASNNGRIDIADAIIFKAEALRLKERLKTVREKRLSGASTLLHMAGMDQQPFQAIEPNTPVIPEWDNIQTTAKHDSSIRSLLLARKAESEKRYAVAKQDAAYPELSFRTLLEQDLETNDTTLFFGVKMALPIWDRNSSELSRAAAEIRLAQAHLDALSHSNYLNLLSTTHTNAQTRQNSVSTYQQEILPAWEKVAAITERKYANGQLSIIEWLQMRDRVIEVQLEAQQAFLKAIEARIELESLLGLSLSEEG